jgi:hypothetical protein
MRLSRVGELGGRSAGGEVGQGGGTRRAEAMQAGRDQALAVAREAVQAAAPERADAAAQARQRAMTAQEGAAAIRLTDATRRLAGLLARLMAALLGE